MRGGAKERRGRGDGGRAGARAGWSVLKEGTLGKVGRSKEEVQLEEGLGKVIKKERRGAEKVKEETSGVEKLVASPKRSREEKKSRSRSGKQGTQLSSSSTSKFPQLSFFSSSSPLP